MISAEAATLALSVAKGLIKLGGRMDRLMAEKEAVTGNLVIPMPPQSAGPDRDERNAMLRKYVAETGKDVPDPLGSERNKLQALLIKNPVPDEADGFFFKIFPEQNSPPLIKPDADFLKALRANLPAANLDEKTNQEVLKAAFYIAAGRDDRGLGYTARIGLLVVDVLAEFGAENTALFVRDANAQTIVKSVLENFAKPDLETFGDWGSLLKHTLGATLNGFLDSREVFAGHGKWADALLKALASARTKAANPDDYLLGLVRGRGYNLLIGEGLRMAGEKLSDGDANAFKLIAADFLATAAPLVEANQHNFGDFFNEHWADLLRGSLSAAAKHSSSLLQGQSPILQQTLTAVLSQLAAVPGTDFFTAETAFLVGETTLTVFARNSALLTQNVSEPWLKEFIGSVAKTISDNGLRKTFSKDGLERIIDGALTTFASHPELIVEKPGLAQDMVRSVLTAVAASDSLSVESLAESAVSGALGEVARHPELAGTQFGPVVAALAGRLSQAVATKSLSSLYAADLIRVAAEAAARNPALLAAGDGIPLAVLNAVPQATSSSPQLIAAGATQVEVMREVFAAFARNGAEFVKARAADKVGELLEKALSAGLARAEAELGTRLDRAGVPPVLGELVRMLLIGELTSVVPTSDEFKTLFNQLADKII